jgi:hypothetical protein
MIVILNEEYPYQFDLISSLTNLLFSNKVLLKVNNLFYGKNKRLSLW